jgi:cell wall-associated NlpC family hydrolase
MYFKIFKILLLCTCLGMISCAPAVRFTTKSTQTVPLNSTYHIVEKNSNNNNSTGKSFQIKSNNELSDNLRESILTEAGRLIGTPYCYGGMNGDCLDCSGFVMLVYNKVGINLPRTASDQFLLSSDLNNSEPQQADLVFFKQGSRINHVGIYTGNEKFIHASSSFGVIVSSLNENYYKNNYAGFRSVIK